MYDITIIGCGIIGASIAYELSKYDISVCVLEAENDVSMGTTKANSAIIHGGYDPEPGTLMAKLNAQGSKIAKDLCQKLSVPYTQIGSLVLAFSEAEMETVEKLYRRGVANGIEQLEVLNQEQVRSMEPNLSKEVVGALYAPTAGIVNPWEYALALAEVAVENGVKLHLNQRVTKIKQQQSSYTIYTENDQFQTKQIINAAGVHAETIHRMLGNEPRYHTIPCRGEYYLLDRDVGGIVNHVIFQCPTDKGKGILVSPTVHGNVIVGPNAENVSETILDTGEDLASTRHGLDEIARGAIKSVPQLNLGQSIRNFSGIRANTDQNDFIIEKVQTGFFDVAGIKSPGLSAAPAIALYIVDLLKKDGTKLPEKNYYIDHFERVVFDELPIAEKRKLIAKNPDYGKIICRCESVTEGEIRASAHEVIPAVSIDGVKRRCRSGMGRCQGGFCGPRILEILAEELNKSPLDINMDHTGSNVLTAETKGARIHERV